MSVLDVLATEEAGLLTEEAFPDWIGPMLATLVDEPFSDQKWIFERKLDGERCLAYLDGDEVRLMSRNRKDITNTYPEVADALHRSGAPRCVLDGEIVAFTGNTTSFQRLQSRMQIKDPDKARKSNIPVYYYVFDMIHVDGQSTRGLPLRRRKAVLRRAISFDDPIRFASHRNESGEAYYEEACRSGWEGLIAKDSTATYKSTRSRDWLKFKCVGQQEFVVGGFTDPEGSRTDFGALLIGYHDDGDFVYAGKVGTGYDDETLETLGSELRRLEVSDPAFDRGDAPSGAHWVEPEVVIEVGFTEWTNQGRLRHPRYLGVRRDKDPGDVVRERPS
jgi:bifunctional non-homologous end joining protein LigD